MTEKKSGRKNTRKIQTSELPVIVIRELTLFPGMSMQFDLEKKPSVQAVEAAITPDSTAPVAALWAMAWRARSAASVISTPSGRRTSA